MGFSASGGARGRVRAEINITPLVDVVLVLLIIFLVLTPVLLKQLPVQVPDKAEAEVAPSPGAQLVVSIAADGAVALNREPVARGELAGRIAPLLGGRGERT